MIVQVGVPRTAFHVPRHTLEQIFRSFALSLLPKALAEEVSWRDSYKCEVVRCRRGGG